MIQVAQIEGKDWRQELHKFLTAHWSTPQMTTGVAPFFLMFGREMRSPELRREAPITNEEIRDRDWARKLTQKDYVDTKRHAVESQVEVGDQVLLRNTKINKLSPTYDPSPCEVMDRSRGEVTLRKKDGVEVKRNVSFVKKYQENGTTESESVVSLQPIANPLESATPLQPITSQPIASQPIASQPIASQPVASPISVQQTVNPSSPMLKASPRPTRTIRLPNDLMIMNCQRLDWTLSLVERLTAVPCLSCYGTELNFFIQYLSLRSRFIVDLSFCSKKNKRGM